MGTVDQSAILLFKSLVLAIYSILFSVYLAKRSTDRYNLLGSYFELNSGNNHSNKFFADEVTPFLGELYT